METKGESELAYLLRREADERAQAEIASSSAKMKHTQLADAYVDLINEKRWGASLRAFEAAQ